MGGVLGPAQPSPSPSLIRITSVVPFSCSIAGVAVTISPLFDGFSRIVRNSMYHPTTRLLTILELLQAHPSLSGAALARRLEVEPRSVRRYITMLQDMGMPIEATHGPGGGYRLRPGFKLPPLLFSEEEATAIVLGLLSSPWLVLGQAPVAVEGALAKVLRVLPVRARE